MNALPIKPTYIYICIYTYTLKHLSHIYINIYIFECSVSAQPTHVCVFTYIYTYTLKHSLSHMYIFTSKPVGIQVKPIYIHYIYIYIYIFKP